VRGVVVASRTCGRSEVRWIAGWLDRSGSRARPLVAEFRPCLARYRRRPLATGPPTLAHVAFLGGRATNPRRAAFRHADGHNKLTR